MHPVMFQNWESLTFLHWRYPREFLQQFLPPGLELDVFEGTGWVGMTPFLLTGLRPPGIPALPWLSCFPETNLRTYVRAAGQKRGIWFFTLEAARLAAVLGARTLYGLPYHWAKMRIDRGGGRVLYTSRRNPPSEPAGTRIHIRIGEAVPNGDLEDFLTARFRLYTTLAGRLAFADVEHEPWPLRKAHIETLEQTLLPACRLGNPASDPLAHYSPGVYVHIGRPVLLG